MKVVKGNLIELAKEGEFDVIAHGCNCFCSQKSGLAPQMVENFYTDKFPVECDLSRKGDINKLGTIDSMTYVMMGPDRIVKVHKFELTVVNAYTQFYNRTIAPDKTAVLVDYMALGLCMRKMNHKFKGKRIGLPKIGAGLAGGDWMKISQIIEREFTDCEVTIVEYDKTVA